MNIIHVVHDYLPRAGAESLAERLRVMPVTVVTGARQTGKTTLVRDLTPDKRRYATLDEPEAAQLARRDPSTLLGGDRLTLDEVQREPRVLSAVKLAVDEARVPGRFLLTGSANLLLMRRVSESLAGRASYLTLWPMARREQLGLGRYGVWDDLLGAPGTEWPDLLREAAATPEDWQSLAHRGGFPIPALTLRSATERKVWFKGYERTYLERDVRDLAQVASLGDFGVLLRAAALRLGQILNQSELGRDVALPQPTVHRYLNLLETSYLLVRLPAYAVHRTKRLVKSPRIYWSDTGLALHLAGDPEPSGAHLENIVLHDLLAWRDTRIDRADVFYWRTVTGAEVDFVVETKGRVLPIEVKATVRPGFGDARHLLAFQREYRDRALPGLLLHDGDAIRWIAEGVLAVPWWRVI